MEEKIRSLIHFVPFLSLFCKYFINAQSGRNTGEMAVGIRPRRVWWRIPSKYWIAVVRSAAEHERDITVGLLIPSESDGHTRTGVKKKSACTETGGGPSALIRRLYREAPDLNIYWYEMPLFPSAATRKMMNGTQCRLAVSLARANNESLSHVRAVDSPGPRSPPQQTPSQEMKENLLTQLNHLQLPRENPAVYV